MPRIGRSFPSHPFRGRIPFGPRAGTASLSATPVLAASGVGDHTGSATLALTLTLAASGVRASRPPWLPTPRPRLRWQLVVGPAAGGHEISLTEARDRRFNFRLTEPTEVSFSVDGRHAQALEIDELRTDVHALYSPSTGPTQIVARARVGNTGDSLDADTHEISVACLDYRAVLARRILYSDSTLVYTADDQAEIAWQLIEQTQNRTGGDLGISRGIGQTTGVVRDRTYEAGDSIGTRVQELSEVIDGFDWDITPISASALHLDIWFPERGTDRGVVLEYGGMVCEVRREVDVSQFANAIRYTGTTDEAGPPPAPAELEVADMATRTEGRWDIALGNDSIVLQSTLDERAAWQLSESEVIRPTYTVRLRQDAWEGPDHIWIGDTVQLVVYSGRLEVSTLLRVYEIQVSLSEDGQEDIELTLGGRKPDFRRWPSAIERRLAELERR